VSEWQFYIGGKGRISIKQFSTRYMQRNEWFSNVMVDKIAQEAIATQQQEGKSVIRALDLAVVPAKKRHTGTRHQAIRYEPNLYRGRWI
jgi:hypothetical protein